MNAIERRKNWIFVSLLSVIAIVVNSGAQAKYYRAHPRYVPQIVQTPPASDLPRPTEYISVPARQESQSDNSYSAPEPAEPSLQVVPAIMPVVSAPRTSRISDVIETAEPGHEERDEKREHAEERHETAVATANTNAESNDRPFEKTNAPHRFVLKSPKQAGNEMRDWRTVAQSPKQAATAPAQEAHPTSGSPKQAAALNEHPTQPSSPKENVALRSEPPQTVGSAGV